MSDDPSARDAQWPSGTVFTIGHSTLPIESFVGALQAYGVEQLADVRTIPRSRRNPQFNADALGGALRNERIDYAPFLELGGLRKPHADSPNMGWRNDGFRGYADYMQMPRFEQALARLIAMSRTARTAIMCAEAVPWRCHRSLLADALLVRGIAVVDILSERSFREHALTPFAHVVGTTVTYPPTQTTLL